MALLLVAMVMSMRVILVAFFFLVSVIVSMRMVLVVLVMAVLMIMLVLGAAMSMIGRAEIVSMIMSMWIRFRLGEHLRLQVFDFGAQRGNVGTQGDLLRARERGKDFLDVVGNGLDHCDGCQYRVCVRWIKDAR